MSEISQLQINDITYDLVDASARDNITTVQNSISSSQWNVIYPVGSIYFTIDLDFDPNTSFYGTWIKLTNGYHLCLEQDSTYVDQYRDAQNTGSTTLTAAQSGLPAHTHAMAGKVAYATNGFAGDASSALSGSEIKVIKTSTYSDGVGNLNATGAVTGGAKNATSGHTHTPGQPKSYGVIGWKRTA